MEFRNSTAYMIPVLFDDLAAFSSALRRENKWQCMEKEELSTDYLLHYIQRIAVNPERFQAFRLKEPERVPVYMFEEEFGFDEPPKISEVRFSCFETGIGFLEFFVEYGNLPLKGITDFAYRFKKASKAAPKDSGRINLMNAAKMLLPKGCDAKIFFDCTADYKFECRCFHMLKCTKEQGNPNEVEEQLSLLKRSYSTAFKKGIDSESSRYDMVYEPYDYDRWGGSQEALVNIVSETGDEKTDFFIDNYKYEHLYKDYHFLYLVLLNQRYSAVHYIAQIAESYEMPPAEFDRLNEKIVQLKTSYSFRVVSNDGLFQNVYSRMYFILDIDSLLNDIQDNEAQMEMLQNSHSVKAEKMTSKFLFGISLLSLFSALIDAAGFFDRFGGNVNISTVLSFCCVVGIVIICVIWLFSGKKRF